MTQKLSPDAYAQLELPDQWIEDIYQQHEARWLLEQIPPGASVLELGYGSGIIVRALAEAGRKVTMVDGSEEFCRRAREIPGVFAVTHSMFEEYEAPEQFDYVIASHVLEHVYEPKALVENCGKWAGRLIAVCGNAESYHRRVAVLMGLQKTVYDLSERDHAVGHYRVFDLADISNMLYGAGWTPMKTKGFMLKALPNAQLAKMPREYIEALCSIPVEPRDAANFGIVCRRFA